jgi:hypothetical protein
VRDSGEGAVGQRRQSDRAPRATLGRDFWLYFSGQLCSQVGNSFTMFALPLLVFKLTHSSTNLALTTAAEFVPYLLFGLVLGAMLDRLPRKRLMLQSDVARAVMIAVIPSLALLGDLHVWVIYAVGFVQSTLGIVFNCGEFAAIPALVRADDLVAANGRIMATNNAGQVVGPILAGALVAVISVPDLLFFDAGSFLVSAVSLLAIRVSFDSAPAPGTASAQRSRVLDDITEGLRFVWHHPVLRSISVMMALINFVGAVAYSQLVLFASSVLHASDTRIAVLFAAGALGVVLTGLSAGPLRRRLSFPVVALGALIVSGLSIVAMAAVGRYWPSVLFWAMSTGFGLLLNINTAALRQAIVPGHLFGRVISIAGVMAWSAIPLGALAGAAAIDLTGSVRDVYAGSGLLTAGIAALFALGPIRQGDRYLAEARADLER